MHVLSTPPAFILSQDQTLKIKVCFPVQKSLLANFKPFYCCLVCSRRTSFCSSRSAHPVLQAVLCSPCIANVLKSHFKDVQPGLFFIRIFRVLNTVQSFIFKVHVVAVLSGNVQYLITLFSLCQQLFQFLFGNLFDFLPRSHGARIIISNVTAKVNSIFQLFSFFYFSQKTAAIQ